MMTSIRNTPSKTKWLAGSAITLALAIGSFAPFSAIQAQKISPALVFGQEAPPPTLDPYFTTSIATRNIAMHVSNS